MRVKADKRDYIFLGSSRFKTYSRLPKSIGVSDFRQKTKIRLMHLKCWLYDIDKPISITKCYLIVH